MRKVILGWRAVHGFFIFSGLGPQQCLSHLYMASILHHLIRASILASYQSWLVLRSMQIPCLVHTMLHVLELLQ